MERNSERHRQSSQATPPPQSHKSQIFRTLTTPNLLSTENQHRTHPELPSKWLGAIRWLILTATANRKYHQGDLYGDTAPMWTTDAIMLTTKIGSTKQDRMLRCSRSGFRAPSRHLGRRPFSRFGRLRANTVCEPQLRRKKPRLKLPDHLRSGPFHSASWQAHECSGVASGDFRVATA